MLTAKRVIILLFVAVVLYFWVVSIFSEKNAPGRGGRYVYSNSLENEKRESDNTFGSFETPAPPSDAPADGKKPGQAPGQAPGNEGGSRPNQPQKAGGQGPQPEPPKPPQPSAIPPDIPHPTPAPPEHVETANRAPSDSKGNEGNTASEGQREKPSPDPSGEEQPGKPVPGESGKPDADTGSKAVVSEEVKRSNADAIKKFNPKDVVLEDYFNQRLNIQISCPKNWTIIQSKTQPEFKCKSDDIDDLFFICKRSRIMEGRKFTEEIDAIVKNEIFGKDLQNKTLNTRAIGKYNLSRITFNEFEINSNEIKSMKNHLIYIFIESGDEVSMFYFVTPHKLKGKVVPIFENIIKSIKIIKRPEPAGTK